MIRRSDCLLLFQWYPIRWIIRSLPRRATICLGQLLGLLSCRLRPGKRTAVMKELMTTLPDLDKSEAEQLIRKGFMTASTVAIESYCFPRLNPANINSWMRIHGESHLRRALNRGRGVVIILAHYGANQMIMAALGYRGYRVNQIGSRPDDWHRLSGIAPTPIERLIFRERLVLEKSLPANFIYIDKSMRPVYQCLERNEIMMLAADGRAGTRFIQARMCGRIMNLSAGPFRIAAATGAALIPVFPVRDADGTHDLHIEEPIEPELATPDADWTDAAASEYGSRLSEWVRFRPDHYVMLMAEARKRSALDPVPLFEDYRHDL